MSNFAVRYIFGMDLNAWFAPGNILFEICLTQWRNLKNDDSNQL